MKHEISAGAVVYAYKHTTCYYLLLLYESGYWGFVKGKSESGETLEQTAVREIAEETGPFRMILRIYTPIHTEKRCTKLCTFSWPRFLKKLLICLWLHYHMNIVVTDGLRIVRLLPC